ncbi:Clp protease ClpP [Pullulanibacillus sp. KACC 23026]|uniref:head maturation protease, ClpP-related n=1 Tax=Pullulanibacillus sp. KACC 23026 TaxID=3028315 RepID=UPI0023B19BFD|nr:head maturation protease, ClpP-related [Pullulanibacillus sp. KACC 23026]WEG14148.1 Clp protease ClpP [Pullulanibacillus sp. KACC 23026]
MPKKINVKGVIVSNDDQWIYNLFGIESTSPSDVESQLEEANGDDVIVHINSGGGDVYAGSDIYTTLKEYGNATTKIVGLAASAASVIAMGGKKVLMSPTGNLMIHNASSVAKGDYRDMAQASDVLLKVNKTISNAYQLKSGMSEQELLDLMDKETWLTPQEALENKLIDEIMFTDDQTKLSASVGIGQMLPEAVINKVRNMKEQFINPDITNDKPKTPVIPPEKPIENTQTVKRPTHSLSFYEKRLKNIERGL